MKILGKYMQPIDLHLVSWMRPKMTELVIRTIGRNTKRENYRLVVWDNGSGKETVAMLQQLQDSGLVDELITVRANVGLEPARNSMLHEATFSPYFICVDNDCLPESPVLQTKGDEIPMDWIERLVDLMERHEEYGAISCRTQVMVGTGNIFEESDKNGDELTDFPHPGGSLRIMRTKTTREVGGWRDLAGRGAEERWIGGKLQAAGYKTAFATNINTLHLFGTRDEKHKTDRWGYNARWKPAKTGHSNVYHPALTNGDDYGEVERYCGTALAKSYFDA